MRLLNNFLPYKCVYSQNDVISVQASYSVNKQHGNDVREEKVVPIFLVKFEIRPVPIVF